MQGHFARALIRASLVALVGVIATLSCGDPEPLSGARSRSLPGPVDAGRESDARGATLAIERPPSGAPDRGRTSGLLLLDVAGAVRCAAALVASNVVLVPMRCLTRFAECRRSDASVLLVRSGDDAHEIVARVREVVALAPCDDDSIAALVMHTHADGLTPLAIRARPANAGEFVRVALMARDEVGPASRRLRDHLRIDAATKSSFSVSGTACDVFGGSMALDEATGEIVGMLVHGASECGASVELVHIDEARALVGTALERAAAPLVEEDGGFVDAGIVRRGKASKPTSDLGDPCEDARGCAAGACVIEETGGYCSRPCGPGDRCPTGLRCERFPSGASACARSP